MSLSTWCYVSKTKIDYCLMCIIYVYMYVDVCKVINFYNNIH